MGVGATWQSSTEVAKVGAPRLPLLRHFLASGVAGRAAAGSRQSCYVVPRIDLFAELLR